MTIHQVFLGIILALFLVAFGIILAFVRGRGFDPRGVIGGHFWGAMLTSSASLLWLGVTLFYIIDARSVTWFGRIALLDNGAIKGVGMLAGTLGLVVCVAGEATLGESFCVAFPGGRGGWSPGASMAISAIRAPWGRSSWRWALPSSRPAGWPFWPWCSIPLATK